MVKCIIRFRYDFTPTQEEKKEILNVMKDMTIKESFFVRTAPIFNQRDPKTAPKQPILNPQTVNLCDILGIDDPVQVVVARTGRSMKEPEKVDTPIAESTINETPPIIATPQTRNLHCSKLSLPAPVTPSVDEIELKSESILVPDDSSIAESLNTSEECLTPVIKKTFKRRNMSIYNTPDNGSEGSVSTPLDSEESPCKLSCNLNPSKD